MLSSVQDEQETKLVSHPIMNEVRNNTHQLETFNEDKVNFDVFLPFNTFHRVFDQIKSNNLMKIYN